MAAHVFVLDSTARRHQIKTSPTTYLRDVLDEACKKFGKDSEHFMLTDSNRPPKILDLSLTMRLSGLVNGARLQLVQGSRSPTVINVALKLPPSVGDGQRLQDKFPSSTSLWLILRKFEEAVAGQASKKLNLTQRGVPSTISGPGYLEYEQPVIKIMQRELSDFVGLQKTLAQLGYNNGSVLLQLEFRNSGLPMEVAVEQISQYFAPLGEEAAAPAPAEQISQPEAAPPAAGAHSGAVTDMSSVPDVSAIDTSGPDEDTTMTDDPAPPTFTVPAEESGLIASSSFTAPEPTSTEPTADSIAVYAAPTSSMPLAALTPSTEEDFLPTIEHAHAHQAVLNRAASNQRLPSNAELAALSQQRQQTLSTIRAAVVRIRFPDQMQVDVNVDAATSGSDLYARTRDMLRDAGLGFELRFTGPKGAPVTLAADAQKLIADLGWRGRVLVTMVWAADVPADKRGKVLKEALVGQAKELSVPVPTAGEQVQGKAEAKEKPKESKRSSKADVEAKMKKFLGFGKKK